MAKINRPPDPATSPIRSPVATSPAAVRAGSMHPRFGFSLTVRRIADLEGNGVIGLLETHVLKQILHPERIGLVVLDEQLYLVQVVLGAVGGTSACHSGFGEPVRVLFEKWVHGA